SREGVNPVLNIFKVPRTDISINDCRFSTFSPVGKSITPIQFDLPAMQEFVDLSRSYFTMKLKLAKTDGKPIKTADDLFLVNNLPHSMIKQVGVRLNGTLINPHTDTYPYKAMIETILNYDREDGKTILRPQGWVNALDVPKEWEETSSSNTDIKISGWSSNQKAAYNLIKAESGRYFNDTNDSLLELRLKMRPHVEPFWFPYVLKPGVQMQFEFHFHDPKFWSMVAGTNTKKLRFTESDIDMRFHLARLKLNDSIYNDLMLKTQNNAQKAVYPVVRSELRTFIWNSDNQLRFEEEDIFNGKVPQRVIVGIVDSRSFNGTKDYYPFSFLKAKIKYIRQLDLLNLLLSVFFFYIMFVLPKNYQLYTPAGHMVVGPSGCGKTNLIENLLCHNLDLFKDKPHAIHYCYGAWQPAYDRMKKHGIRFHQGVPQEQHISSWFPKGGILILDDLMDECGNDKNILDIFTKYSHHKNVSVIYLLQDIFPIGKYSKTISRNVHYVWAFKNPRDQVGIRNLLMQAFPTNWSTVLDTFQKVTEQPHAYLLLDFHPTSPDTQRVLSNVLKDQGITNCWQF
ncbi:unnamed protein product, partial [Porites lobata]